MRLVLLAALGWALAAPLSAKFTPMQADKFLVAGSSDKGLRDGEFWQAAFDGPMGLALSWEGDKLYVGDTGNRAIRVVDLKQNLVSTRWKLSAATKAPLDASELAVLGGDLYFLPSDGKGLWRLAEGSPNAVLVAGSSLTAGTVSAPVVVSPYAEVLWLDLAAVGGARLVACNAAGVSRNASAAIAGLGSQDGSRLTALNGLLYVIRQGQLSRLDLAAGYAGAFSPNGDTGAAALAPQPANILTGIAWPIPANGKGCFAGWDPKTSGLRIAYPQGLTQCVALQDQVGGLISDVLAGTERAPNIPVPQQYPWVVPGGRGVYDSARGKLYFSDPYNRHIVGWAWTLADPEHWEYYYVGPPVNEPKDPEVKHLLVVCNSLFPGVSDHTPFTIRKSMYKQFELHYNMLNALAGTGKRYIVPLKGGSIGITRGVTSFAVNHVDEFVRVGADEVVVCVEPKGLIYEMICLLTNAQTDDLVAAEIDPVWATLSKAEQKKGWGPITREMIELFAKNKAFFPADANGSYWELTNNPSLYFSDLKFTKLMLKFQDKMLGKLEAAVKDKPYKVRFLIMPFSRAGAPGDIQGGINRGDLPPDLDLDEAFASVARAHGFLCVNMVPTFRLLGPTLMPFYDNNDHYIAQGHMWLGQIAAQLYFNETQAEAKK